jgi:hypothetical protein
LDQPAWRREGCRSSPGKSARARMRRHPGTAARRAPALGSGESIGTARGTGLRRWDRGDDAGRAHHRGAARREPGHRLRASFHQPAHRRALRGRERAARRGAGRCNESGPGSHGGGEPRRHPRQADLDRRRLHPLGDLPSGARPHHRRAPRPPGRRDLGRWHHLGLGSAVLPLGRARRRRRRGERALRPRPWAWLLHPRLRPARPLQRAGHVGHQPRLEASLPTLMRSTG